MNLARPLSVWPQAWDEEGLPVVLAACDGKTRTLMKTKALKFPFFEGSDGSLEQHLYLESSLLTRAWGSERPRTFGRKMARLEATFEAAVRVRMADYSFQTRHAGR
ncbi:MAG: hypothetical protein QOJ99_691 [Bryobacterales bacterium]|jgi:hypothetical protein|nr:hypothetical protein [Bryobacterales bacterium]